MTPIKSFDDIRLVTLVSVAIDLIESVALLTDEEPSTVLAEHLYTNAKKIHDCGTDTTIHKLLTHYPILQQAIA